MKIQYVTAEQAEVMRRKVSRYWDAAPLVPRDSFWMARGVGEWTEWHVVPDGDPRLQTTDQVSHTIK